MLICRSLINVLLTWHAGPLAPYVPIPVRVQGFSGVCFRSYLPGPNVLPSAQAMRNNFPSMGCPRPCPVPVSIRQHYPENNGRASRLLLFLYIVLNAVPASLSIQRPGGWLAHPITKHPAPVIKGGTR